MENQENTNTPTPVNPEPVVPEQVVVSEHKVEEKVVVQEPKKPEKEEQKPGPDSILTEELTLQIRKLVLEGTKYKEIQEKLKINPSTWDRWVWLNYKDFRVNLNEWVHERIVKKAQKNLEEFVDMPIEKVEVRQNLNYDEDDEENNSPTIEIIRTDPALVRIKQDSTKFALERLDKENFASRSEFTGKSGGKLFDDDSRDKAKKAIGSFLNSGDTGQREQTGN